MSRAARGRSGQRQLRIIGGQWRGRKLSFTPLEGLRPTTDRVRETLFNWLAPDVRGARCLDLFAGSGALGLEALSRGAAHCSFVERAPASLRQIQSHLALLGAGERGQCHPGCALEFLRRQHRAWDIVFLDPPFGQQLAEPSCALLARPGVLARGGVVYLETAAGDPIPAAASDWQLHREKTAGGVCYRLFIVAAD